MSNGYIKNRKELKFFILADRIISSRPIHHSFLYRLSHLIYPDYVDKFQNEMRYCQYLDYKASIANRISKKVYKLLLSYHKMKFNHYGRLCGFAMGFDVFDYGLFIPHHGTIVVNADTKAGKYCVLFTSTCIGGEDKIIGDGLYLSTGAVILGDVTVGSSCTVAANSVVKSNLPDDVLAVGMPAKVKKDDYPVWYLRDGEKYHNRVKRIESIKEKMGL